MLQQKLRIGKSHIAVKGLPVPRSFQILGYYLHTGIPPPSNNFHRVFYKPTVTN